MSQFRGTSPFNLDDERLLLWEKFQFYSDNLENTTFKEYLVHYSTPETREIGEKVIESMLQEIPDAQTRAKTEEYLQKIVDGGKDLYF